MDATPNRRHATRTVLLDAPRVDDNGHVGDGDGGLRHVRRDHHFLFFWGGVHTCTCQWHVFTEYIVSNTIQPKPTQNNRPHLGLALRQPRPEDQRLLRPRQRAVQGQYPQADLGPLHLPSTPTLLVVVVLVLVVGVIPTAVAAAAAAASVAAGGGVGVGGGREEGAEPRDLADAGQEDEDGALCWCVEWGVYSRTHLPTIASKSKTTTTPRQKQHTAIKDKHTYTHYYNTWAGPGWRWANSGEAT